jgi:tetratricopeptide (TPR) repeat protein
MSAIDPVALLDRLDPAVAGFAADVFVLADDLRHLAEVRRAGAPEAVILYCSRITEALAGNALRRVGLESGRTLVVTLDLLDRYGLLPRTTLAYGHGLRRLGNDVRHLNRRVADADAEMACLFAERCLTWFFCRCPAGPGLPALTRDAGPLELAGDQGLRDLLARLERGDCDPAAEVGRPGWDASAVVPARLAEVLIDQGRLVEARVCLDRVPPRYKTDPRLRQLHGLWLSRSGRLDEAAQQLEKVSGSSANDEETDGILGGVHKRRWRKGRDNRAALKESHEAYLRGWKRSEQANVFLGINVAATALWLNRPDESRGAADKVWETLTAREQQLRSTAAGNRAILNYWDRATLAEAALLRGQTDAARRLYNEAFALRPDDAGSISSTREQLADLLPALGLPANVDAFLGPQAPGGGVIV